MFKKLKGKLFGQRPGGGAAEGFFLNVRCSHCGEQFRLFINKHWELIQDFHEDGRVTYLLKKEIYGVGCRNRIFVTMKFDSARKLVSRKIENGEFLDS